MTLAELFPIEQGRVMVYGYDGGDAVGEGPRTATMTFGEVREENGALRATVTETVPRRKRPERVFVVRRDASELVEANGSPELLLKEPIVVGTEWLGGVYEMQIKAVDAEVTVPAGTFKCVQVGGWVEDMGADSFWYAPGVGLVKAARKVEPPRRVYELMSVKPGPGNGKRE